MELVLRATAVYVFLWLVLRLAGKRAFSEMSTFDFVLLLIVSESAQEALLGEDFSITAAAIVILTLVGIDVGISLIKLRRQAVSKVLDGMPVVIVEHGKPLSEIMQRERVDEDEVLEEARKYRGLERLDQIKYAVLERNGGISIIPFDRQT